MNKHINNFEDFINEQKALLEYDRSTFRSKYDNLPKDRMDKIIDYSTERQVKNGISLTNNDGKDCYYVTEDDFDFMHIGDKRYTNAMKNAHKICSGDYKNSRGVIDYERVRKDFRYTDFEFFNKELNGLKNEISIYLTFHISNAVTSFIMSDKKRSNNHNFRGVIRGTLVKLADKYAPPFQFNVNSIEIGDLTPTTPKDNIKLIKTLEGVILKNFNDPRGDFYIQSVKIDRNSFYK